MRNFKALVSILLGALLTAGVLAPPCDASLFDAIAAPCEKAVGWLGSTFDGLFVDGATAPAIDHAEEAGRQIFRDVDKALENRIKDLDVSVKSRLEQADGILKSRVAQVGQVLADRIEQVDTVLATRTTDLDEKLAQRIDQILVQSAHLQHNGHARSPRTHPRAEPAFADGLCPIRRLQHGGASAS